MDTLLKIKRLALRGQVCSQARLALASPSRVAAVLFVAWGSAAFCDEPAGSRATSQPASLRVVTWNIQKGEGGVDRVIADLASLNVDVLLLQELIEPEPGVAGIDQVRRIAQALDMHAQSDCGPLDADRNQCIAILSRNPMRDIGRLATDTDRAYAVTATIDAPNGPIQLVCVHLTGTWRIELAHVAETVARREREVAHLTEWLTTQTLPIIVAGDFNPLTPNSAQAWNKG